MCDCNHCVCISEYLMCPSVLLPLISFDSTSHIRAYYTIKLPTSVTLGGAYDGCSFITSWRHRKHKLEAGLEQSCSFSIHNNSLLTLFMSKLLV